LLFLTGGTRLSAWTSEAWRAACRKAYGLWSAEVGQGRDRERAWKLLGKILAEAKADLALWREDRFGAKDVFAPTHVGFLRNLRLVHSDYFELEREGPDSFDLETMEIASEHPVTRLAWTLADRSGLLLRQFSAGPNRKQVDRAMGVFRQGIDLVERDLGPLSPFLIPMLERQAAWLRDLGGPLDLAPVNPAPSATFPRLQRLGLALELLHRSRGIRADQPGTHAFSVFPAVRALLAVRRDAGAWKAPLLPRKAALRSARTVGKALGRATLDAWMAQGRWALIRGRRREAEELYQAAHKLVRKMDVEGSLAEAEFLVRWADALFWGPRNRTRAELRRDCRRALPKLRRAWEIRVALRATRNEEASQLLLRWSQAAEGADYPDERADVEWKRYDLARNLGWGILRLPRGVTRIPVDGE
jgi:hypothetical protein